LDFHVSSLLHEYMSKIYVSFVPLRQFYVAVHK